MFLKIGPVTIENDLVLAPMDGFSDSPTRLIARRFGSGISFSEFINAIDIEQKNPRLAQRIKFNPEERPFAYQIMDNNPNRIYKAALFLLDFEPDIIDINLGCCSKSVANRGAGAGLLKKPELIVEIFSILNSLNVPLTAKIRIGWDDHSRNYLDIARILEDNGCNLISVHGRTRLQQYNGKADWDTIAKIKEAVKIPIIGNGDILSLQDIDRMKEHTNCDGVMIGRGAIGNPWIFSRVDKRSALPEQVKNTMIVHLQNMENFYGNQNAILLFRKHANAYLKNFKIDFSLRHDLLTVNEKSSFLMILNRIFQSISPVPNFSND